MSEIEKALIGSLIMDSTLWDEVRVIIDTDDFADPKMSMFFGNIKELRGKCDSVILTRHMRGKNIPDMHSIILLMNECMEKCMPNVAITYAQTIKEDSKRKKTKTIGERIRELATSNEPMEDIIRKSNDELLKLIDTNEKEFRPSNEIAMDYANHMANMKLKGLKISGIPSGYKQLDEAIDGFQNGGLYIIGARPSIGKTSMMLCLAEHMAIDFKKNVAIFSIESPERELFNKMVSIRSEIPTNKLRINALTTYEDERYMSAVEELGLANISVNDLCMIDVLMITAQIKRLINSCKTPDIIFIDYLQIILTEKSSDLMAYKIGRVTQGIKNLAKQINVPIVVLAQINRENGEAPPRLMDLKDSGAIEAIADCVILLHRDEFYTKVKCEEENKGKIDVDVAKNRNGIQSLIKMKWIGSCTKIKEIPKYE